MSIQFRSYGRPLQQTYAPEKRDSNGQITPGAWRQEGEPTSSCLPLGRQGSNNQTKIHDSLKDYFMEEGSGD